MSDSYTYLEFPLHKNYIAFELSDDDKSNLMFSIEGGIQAVKTQAIKPYLDDQEIKNIRLGYAKRPKTMKVDSMDGLLKLLALYSEE